jgi:hypothetical protein
MAKKFLHTMLTPLVLDSQEHYYGKRLIIDSAPANDPLTDDERLFIEERDSFYMATITENGWPYIQHRGGPTGFLRVLSPTQLAFADYKGNRQLLSTGNLAANDRAALFLMDYPQRIRLKILGRIRVEDAREQPDLVVQLADPDQRDRVERLFVIDIVSFDWNCPQYITPRYSAAEMARAVEPLQARIADLEAHLENKGSDYVGPKAIYFPGARKSDVI